MFCRSHAPRIALRAPTTVTIRTRTSAKSREVRLPSVRSAGPPSQVLLRSVTSKRVVANQPYKRSRERLRAGEPGARGSGALDDRLCVRIVLCPEVDEPRVPCDGLLPGTR